jgi:hypothetical protein
MKPRAPRHESWKDSAGKAVLTGILLLGLPAAPSAVAPQTGAEVSPEAAPEIRQVKPPQAAAGEEVTVIVEGRNFSPGAYVSFSTPAVRVLSTRRVSPTEVEARIAVGKKAPSGAMTLFVSNSASVVAEAAFTVTGGPAPPEALAPAAATPPATAYPAQASSLVPAAAVAGQPAATVPEVTRLEPVRAGRGSELELKIHGKNFAKGAKVAFSNPGIRVLGTQVAKDTEMTVRIQIAADAATGAGGLFVVNPDDNETEAAFVVTDEAPARMAPAVSTASPAPAAAPVPASAPAKAGKGAAEPRNFEVLRLADVAGILQKGNRAKGTLTLAEGNLRYEESGKEVFVVPAAEVKEIGANTILGMNTGTFHVILNSGQTYNFIAASLRPADSESIIDALRKAVK